MLARPQKAALAGHRGAGFRWRALLCALALLAAPVACGDEASAICNKIYDDCAGALVDQQGASISREACIRLIEKRSNEDAQKVQSMAECVAQSSCEALPACFGGG